MKFRLAHAIFLAYIILISLITGKFQLPTLLIFGLVIILTNFFIKDIINSMFENFIYVILALVPFPFFLSLFLFFLPFCVFGLLLKKRSFIKNYVFGFAISLIPTVLIYTSANYFDIKINSFIIAAFFYLPVILAFIIALRRKKQFDFFHVNSNELFVILLVLVSCVYVGINIVNDDSLFISNGTYQYVKFALIKKSITSYERFPLYDPATSQGESPFLFESPLVFSHLGFVNVILSFIPTIAFYNTFQLFIVFLSVLSLSVLIMSIMDFSNGERNRKKWNILIIALCSIIIGLNFYFVQLLESFKQFFAFPINYLIFSLILEKPKTVREMLLIGYMIVLTFVIHTPHGVGIVLISFSLVALIIATIFFSGEIRHATNWIWANKFKILIFAVLLISLAAFYIMPTIIFKDFLEDKPKIDWKGFMPASLNYIKSFPDVWPLSLRYPDVRRNDDKKAGPVISIFGPISLIALLIFYRKNIPSNLTLFSGAYLLHFWISSIIINFPSIDSLEYTYRTAEPYLIIIFAAFICAFIILASQKYIKLILTIVLIASVLHMLPFSKQNIENVHTEQIMAGKVFANEINFFKNIPNDGRVITYGMFANAIDPAMASLTGKYFSRFHLTEVARSRSIYNKIHSSHSFGQADSLLAMSGIELSNYLRLGGYRYIFLDLRHPVSGFVVNKVYPNFSYGISLDGSLAVLVVNGTNYAEKLSVLRKIDDNVYKNEDGYKYITLSKNYSFSRDVQYSQSVGNPEKLDFIRISPAEVEIDGSFNDNDWITFKETYSTRWHAFMNGNEVPVLASNQDLILINSVSGSKISLVYKPLPVEKIFGTVSFISASILIAFFVFSL